MSKLVKEFIGDDEVGYLQILLENDQYLRSRNFADSANINLLKVNTSDQIEFATEPVVSGSALARLNQVSTISALNTTVTDATIATVADLGSYVTLSTSQTISGLKTFSTFPVTPSTAPTTDYQVANKKYVDDEVTAAGGYNDELAQDAFGAMLTGTQTRITVTYDDLNNEVDFVVDDNLANYDNTASGFITDSTTTLSLLSTVGTITTGVWNGTALTAAYVPNHDDLNGFVAVEHLDWTLDQGLTNINQNNITQGAVTQHQASLSILSSQISDFASAVSSNSDVAANTSNRHVAVTVLDSAEINFTLSGQQITASLVSGSIDILKLNGSVQTSLGLADSALQSGDNISLLTNNSGYITDLTSETLGSISDVTITTVADNEILAYNNGTGEWINQTAAEAGLATAAQGSLADTATQPGDNVSDLINDAGYLTSIPATYIQETDIDTLAELNAIVTDATLVDGANYLTEQNWTDYTILIPSTVELDFTTYTKIWAIVDMTTNVTSFNLINVPIEGCAFLLRLKGHASNSYTFSFDAGTYVDDVIDSGYTSSYTAGTLTVAATEVIDLIGSEDKDGLIQITIKSIGEVVT